MLLNNSFFISSSGLFDFDMTFLSQALLFFFLSLSITNFFLLPISKTIEERNTYISQILQKVDILVALACEQSEEYTSLLVEERKELNRQNHLLKNYLKIRFQKEVENIQKENQLLINKVKVSFILQSMLKLKSLSKVINEISQSFFNKKISSK